MLGETPLHSPLYYFIGDISLILVKDSVLLELEELIRCQVHPTIVRVRLKIISA